MAAAKKTRIPVIVALVWVKLVYQSSSVLVPTVFQILRLRRPTSQVRKNKIEEPRIRKREAEYLADKQALQVKNLWRNKQIRHKRDGPRCAYLAQ